MARMVRRDARRATATSWALYLSISPSAFRLIWNTHLHPTIFAPSGFSTMDQVRASSREASFTVVGSLLSIAATPAIMAKTSSSSTSISPFSPTSPSMAAKLDTSGVGSIPRDLCGNGAASNCGPRWLMGGAGLEFEGFGLLSAGISLPSIGTTTSAVSNTTLLSTATRQDSGR
ncbi:hypothetical protein BDR06DRAFT_976636 [Suillus hirtellus]|nr:hypothetical protein BDR06DRAFT_976636 [Suillus hirtellus]